MRRPHLTNSAYSIGALIMVFCVFLSGECLAYVWDHQAAVNYALTWYNQRNTARYQDYSDEGGDCANFVSQCLIAGGLDLSASPYIDDYGCILDCDELNYFLISCPAVARYQIEPRTTGVSNEPAWFQPGDIAIFGVSANEWNHTAICVFGHDMNDAKCASHTLDTGGTTIPYFFSLYPEWNQCTFYDIGGGVDHTEPASTHFAEGDTLTVTATAVKMRSGPCYGAATVNGSENTSLLHSGDVVQVLSDANNGIAYNGYHWWKMQFGAYQGWCAGNDTAGNWSFFGNAATVTKCTVTAGKTQGRDENDISNIKDYFTASGTADFRADLNDINLIEVTINDACDGSVIYSQSIDFNDYNDVANKKGKYSYSHKIARGEAGAITSLKIDFTKSPSTFSVIAKNIDLTGLGCPLRLGFNMGDYILSSHEVNEAIVNGKKTLIPTRLMRVYKDTIVVRKAKTRNSTKSLGDSLSVSGDIAVADMDLNANEPNLVNEDVNVVWGSSTFTIPATNFKAVGLKHLYKCSKIHSAEDSNNLVTATIDLDQCTYSISVKNVNLADVDTSGTVTFGINFATPLGDFNEAVDVNLATGRSY